MRAADAPRFEVIPGWQKIPEEVPQLEVVGAGVDSRDRVYVLTRDENAQVTVFEQDGSFVMAWGKGVFSSHTHSLYVGPDDAVWCTDDADHTIKKFTTDGKLLMTLGTSGVASDSGYDPAVGIRSIVRGAPPFNKPTNICVAPSGDLYVSDGYGNARVHRFTADGKVILSWGEPGTGPGQFHYPHDVRVAPDGRVLVADRENERIQIFSPDGEFLDQWTDVQRPTGLYIDAKEGLVYVAELWWAKGQRSEARGLIEKQEFGRVCILDIDDGEVLSRWGGVPDCCAPGNFAVPHTVCLDSRGDLYVSEVIHSMGVKRGLLPSDCHSLQKFARVR